MKTDEPRAALQHIEQLCRQHASLFGAIFAVLGSQPAVPRAYLAQAIKQFRPDADAYTVDDVMGLLTATVNGAQQSFDAVLRTRRGSERKAVALPFVRPD